MSSNLDLNKYLSGDNSDYVDNTKKLRTAKHSIHIRKNINEIEKLRAETGDLYKTNIEEFKNKCFKRNSFLYNNYFEIFNRVTKGEMNLIIMNQFLNVLQKIEEGEIDQHEGSVKVGELLKELYIDSALRRTNELEKDNPKEVKQYKEAKSISWKQYKNMNTK
jgi:hypothetical protein